MISRIKIVRLLTKKSDEDLLDGRFEIGRKIYNLCLLEIKRRYDSMRKSPEYAALLEMPRGKKRSAAVKKLLKASDLEEYAIYRYIVMASDSYEGLMDPCTAQKIASFAWNACERALARRSFSIKLLYENEFNAIESMSNDSGIMYSDGFILWNGLKIACLHENQWQDDAVEFNVEYCGMQRNVISGKRVYHAFLVLKDSMA
ncbi:MAG: hypothetical protein LBU32_01630 [Clostridiales bacterium]|jgi:hypothetical protein|nr:hypothetical protein [Clostridiales bacterium]